jgi:hypothetical protein
MLAVDNNSIVTQAGSACQYGCTVDYSTAMYTAVTDDNGAFSIANVPNDTVLSLYVDDYRQIDVNDDVQVRTDVIESYIPSTVRPDDCGDDNVWDDCWDGEYITTINEGIVNLGDVCAEPVVTGDTTRPCVTNVEEWVSPAGRNIWAEFYYYSIFKWWFYFMGRAE